MQDLLGEGATSSSADNLEESGTDDDEDKEADHEGANGRLAAAGLILVLLL